MLLVLGRCRRPSLAVVVLTPWAQRLPSDFEKQAVVISRGNRNDAVGNDLFRPCLVIVGCAVAKLGRKRFPTHRAPKAAIGFGEAGCDVIPGGGHFPTVVTA